MERSEKSNPYRYTNEIGHFVLVFSVLREPLTKILDYVLKGVREEGRDYGPLRGLPSPRQSVIETFSYYPSSLRVVWSQSNTMLRNGERD